MNWLAPFVVHGAHEVSDAQLREAGRQLRERLAAWQDAARAKAAD
jgi:putative NADPH-quinone reductase